jgi:hypothetical protein
MRHRHANSIVEEKLLLILLTFRQSSALKRGGINESRTVAFDITSRTV